MEKLDLKSKGRQGNDRYEGFVVDLAMEISRIVGFNFTIRITDGYGSVDERGQWNGMIRELLEEVGRPDRAGYSLNHLSCKTYYNLDF